MGEPTATITMELNTALNIITILIMSIGGFFVKRQFSDYDNHKKKTDLYQESTTKEINEVKLNYLDRFEGLTAKLTDTKEKLTESINNSEKNLTKLINDHLGKK